MIDSTHKTSETLLTKKSLALSLAAPRVPPHGTTHRALLIGGDPTVLPWTRHHDSHHGDKEQNGVSKQNTNLQRKLMAFLKASAKTMKDRPHQHLPHPHLPTGPELAEYLTRTVGVWCPLHWQNWLRDEGYLRALCDRLVTLWAPTMCLAYPQALHEFHNLTQRCTKVRYGKHPSQVIDMFLPDQPKKAKGLAFFVHGGAWGSGMPWMYRLVATPFLEKGMAVAIIGYRTYPCGDVPAQVLDLEMASEELSQQYPEICQEPTELGVCVLGHSSGAHTAFLMMAEWTRLRMEKLEKETAEQGKPKIITTTMADANRRGMRIDSFIGISGPYQISHHFDFEASKGLEELSPLKPACGYSREAFRKHSPALKIMDCMAEWSRECEQRALDNVIPRILLLHGIEDDVVPFTSCAEAASLLRSCGVTKLEEVYLAKTGHSDCALQLMMGGKMRDVIMGWLDQTPAASNKSTTNLIINSRI